MIYTSIIIIFAFNRNLPAHGSESRDYMKPKMAVAAFGPLWRLQLSRLLSMALHAVKLVLVRNILELSSFIVSEP